MTVRREIRRREQPDRPSALTDVHPVIRRVYLGRGAGEPADLDLALSALLPIRTLGGTSDAAELLIRHRTGRVLVVGDFDADGATSSALMLLGLGEFGFDAVDFLVPNRFEFGYGLSAPLAAVALERSPTLVVTVDNGISSHAGVALLRDAGVDVLITDHHLPPDPMPAANVIVNPNNPGESFGSPALAGVGVAFYVLAATEKQLVDAGEAQLAGTCARFLDLVALGTVADVVPLDRNNRILINAGLARIRARCARPGILALLAEAGRDPTRCTATDLAFGVGPRLNAAGRLEDMSAGILALVTDDPAEARRQATALGAINQQRRDLQQRMQEQALNALPELPAPTVAGQPCCISLSRDDWHQGVVGLVANFVREQSQRPAFAFAPEGIDTLKGSGRSVAAVHLRDLLARIDAQNPGMITRFGGHAMAAGLTLPRSRFTEFAAAADAACRAMYPNLTFAECWLSDGELAPEEQTLALAEALREAGPYGAAFEEPTFDGLFQVIEARQVGDDHVKLRLLAAADNAPLDAIAFRQADVLPLPAGTYVQLVYRLDVNDYRGIRRVQLVVEQLTAAPSSAAG